MRPLPSRTQRSAVGFAVAALVLVVFVGFVGFDGVAAELAGASLSVYAAGVVAAVLAVGCWSEGVRWLAHESVARPGYRRAYYAGEFFKLVIPLGQAAGPAFVAYTVSRRTDADYETVLAATTVAEVFNILAAVLTGTLALAVLAAAQPSPVLVALAAGLGVTLLALLAAVAVAVYRRQTVERATVWAAGLLARILGRIRGEPPALLQPAAVHERVERYYRTVGAVPRRRLAVLAGFSLSGWLLFLVPAYASFLAIGANVSPLLLAAAVPAVGFVNVVPLPGGLGGFEAGLAAVLVAVGNVGLETATAGVLLYRVAAYWVLLVVCGLAAGSLSVSLRDPPGVEDLDP